MATFKQISDAIITQIAAATGFNTTRVGIFKGSVIDFLDGAETPNLPFCGVTLISADYGEYLSDNAGCREDLTFRLTVIAEDFRGQGYSTEDNYTLLEAIRGTLLGDSLSLAGVNPLRIERIAEEADIADHGVTVYNMDISTFQAR